MRIVHALVLAPLIALAYASPASARCEGMVMLGALHDAYLATLRGTPPDQRLGAKTVLVIAGDENGAALARQVSRSGVELDRQRLSQAVRDAREIAEQTLDGTRPSEIPFQHSMNVDWFGDIYAASGCNDSASKTSLTPVEAERSALSSSPSDDAAPATRHLLYIPAIVVLVAVALFSAYKVSKSVFLRTRRVERMPRYPISLPLALTYTDAEGHIQETDVEAMDISRGGLKLSWPDPPPSGTLVTLPILSIQRIGQVTWTNAYYAGLLLEAQLSQKELNTLKELHHPD